jgi:hypothetical protein
MKRILTVCAVLLVAVAAMAQGTTKRYGIKSGEFKTEMDMMGQKILATTYFDDYGNLQVSKTKMEMMGMSIDMATLLKDGKQYTINYGDKTVQEMPAQESINYLNLTDEVIAKYKIKTLGTETVNGKECTKYSAEINQMGMTVKTTVSVWQGFPMKSVVDASGMNMTQYLKDIQEGPVDAALFEIPKF